MKRLLSLALSAALLAALTLPAAAAEETADARLAKVTQAVKKTLDLDTEGYDKFSSGASELLVPYWDLNWRGDSGSLSISALEDGSIISYHLTPGDSVPVSYRWSFPSFPESAGAEDRAAAEDFLKRVLRPGESAELQDRAGASLNASDNSWNGTIFLNGLPSPLHYYLTAENGQVVDLSRDLPENTVVGGVPSPDASVEKNAAAKDLNETLKLRLEYVLAQPGGTKAVPRYVPEATHDFQVDAKTGELLDVTELEELLEKNGSSAGGAMDTAAPTDKAEAEGAADRNGLTHAELEGVEKLEGVLTRQELDKALRAESAYGLRGYALMAANYEAGEDAVTCSLRYTRMDNGERRTRGFTVDAKTGAVESVWSSAPFHQEKKVTEEEALKKAEAFLKIWCPDKDLTLYQTGYELMPWRMEELPYWGFTFAQEVGGLPFRQNAVHVNIDSTDGSIYYLSSSWDDGITFDSAGGLVSMEAALSAWAGTYDAVLAYRNVPQKLVKSDPVQARLMEQDMEYYHALRLTWALEREETFEGVDAKTGELVRETNSSNREPLAYTDLGGSSARADIEKLARYGVGFEAEKFRPSKNLTQWELAALVYSLQGPAMDPEKVSADQRDSAYSNAYRWGLLRPADRKDNAVLTRADLVRMLLDASGYGPAARLGRDIFTCSYTDKGSIPEDGLGYAAVAQALGMASGTYAGSRNATRAEAASMLCRVLERAG